MGEHVVQLTGDPAALGERGGGRLRIACVTQLREQQLGTVLTFPADPDELAGHRQQQAHQRRGDHSLRRRVLGRPDRHPERHGDRRARGGCTAASATPLPPTSPITAAWAAGPRSAQLLVSATAAATT